MNSAFVSLAERLAGELRGERNDRFRRALYARQSDAGERNRLRTSFYADEQREMSLAELKSRGRDIWKAYERVAVDTGVPWSDEVEQSIVARIERQLTEDARTLEEMASNVITPHGHSFDLFLTNAVPSIVEQLSAEVELFGMRYRPVSTSLATLLQAPRYAGVHGHWMKAESFVRSSPPDLANATKEAVSGLEAAAKVVTGLRDGTLGECLKLLRAKQRVDPAIAKTLDGLWGFANTSPGVRHGSPDVARVTDSESRYVLECCEAGIKLLLTLDT